ncbi:hypothetical protein [Deinococcus radiotolerans]|uniref:Uncharacterized protein n=1 Tax=Deinococcus radiotolerans TaxID=1309407 RepID=A0ABQ2FQN4_9DEIO|nr:hypothetical protein [Deinococcus radiotolerans]GGL17437.1 hypothetical protein GCM10010844_40350 [Deinococcus radiotolerans]
MAHPDLTGPGPEGLDWIPLDAAQAFVEGDERWAAVLLARARDAELPGSVAWARLERLQGLCLIHVQREVEGTFALERADALLDAAGIGRPDLGTLEARGLTGGRER